MKLSHAHSSSLFLLCLTLLLALVTALDPSELPDDIEEIEIDVARLKGMPGVKIVENVDDAYAAIEEEKLSEERARTKSEAPPGGKKSKKTKKGKGKGKGKKSKSGTGAQESEKDWRNEL